MVLGQLGGGQFGEAADGSQDVVEVVGYPPGQPPDRLHPLGLDELDFEGALVRDVSSHGNRAGNRAGRVSKRRHGHVHVDGRAVHSLQDDAARPALACDQSRGHFRQLSGGDVLAKQARVVAQHFGHRVSGHSLERRIEICDVAGPVGREDRLRRLIHGRCQTLAFGCGQARVLA